MFTNITKAKAVNLIISIHHDFPNQPLTKIQTSMPVSRGTTIKYLLDQFGLSLVEMVALVDHKVFSHYCTVNGNCGIVTTDNTVFYVKNNKLEIANVNDANGYTGEVPEVIRELVTIIS